ncbi:adenylate/guanylate cyclase domain-containing protein [Epibacterium sp. SM1979]|uniref:Adenylate/guanylate cyclase domain-containing protein n=1 Tax=Tritonibacter litoralis TaxID=2662264 RepID=A0A843YHB3_9RHOB|nr:adenylate/guanylate cyclase domain-containing protein [Tritonibacter litoralis]MQQ08157.1 adenylate/guanylate cyclase domain-containing protein [Tritonibacter litoralis]
MIDLSLLKDTDSQIGETANPRGRSGEAYARAALEDHKRAGLELAVKARWIALGFTAVFIFFVYPDWGVLYYHAILAILCLNGLLIRRFGRVGQSRIELLLIFADLVIMTFAMVFPNPFGTDDLPVAFNYRFDNFQYFFIILAAGTMAYSWRTVIAIGTWTSALWLLALALAWFFSEPSDTLQAVVVDSLAAYPRVLEILDPNNFVFSLRIQEVMVFLLSAAILGFSIRRFDALLISNAALERERANLSRYFSPNVVERLSQNDDPLKEIKRQDIAVLFVDIVGFTGLSEKMSSYDVITLLREFHGRMEREVFRHNGTLDKYLGDGLMATFGTPVSGERNASDAVACGRAMLRSMDQWNTDRKRRGEPVISIGVGVHYGEALLGDIGANRLEYAVIGTAVNIASRLEGLTRALEAKIVMSDDLYRQSQSEAESQDLLQGFSRIDRQEVRGIQHPITVWALS